MSTNVPLRRVISDLAIVAIAQTLPKSVEDLAHVRGVDERYLGGSMSREILAAVKTGREQEVVIENNVHEALDKKFKPVVTLITAWIAELSRANDIDPMLVATNRDVIAFLAGGESRLASGWRRDLVGLDLERLRNGELGLSFDRDGRLRLIPAT
jgi:ribonuclease D